MITRHLYRQGNSIVLAIPRHLMEHLDADVGDVLAINGQFAGELVLTLHKKADPLPSESTIH